MVRIGVFGARRGDCMIHWCNNSGRAEVVAICDQDATVMERIRKQYPNEKIRYFEEFDAFLSQGDFDAVVLANYANEHAPFAIRCMEAGKHVLSEVLPCQCMNEAVALVEAVERTGQIYAYAENYCYMPVPREIRRLYRSGRLGKFEYAEGEYVHNCEPIWPMITYGERGHWRNRMHANFYCTHSLGPLIHITGLRPVSVIGIELPYSDRNARMGSIGGTAGLELVTLENGGVVKSLHGGLDKDSIWYSVYGSRGRAESARENGEKKELSRIYINLDRKEGVYQDLPETYEPTDELSAVAKTAGHGSSDYYVMYNFVEAIEGNTNAEIIDVYEALDMFLPGMFAYFSVLDGSKPQRIPNLRSKEERELWRNDRRCTDPSVAGEQLIPSYSKGVVEIVDTVYDRIRIKYKNSIKEDTK